MGKKNTPKVEDYINNLDGNSMTGSWTPKATWHRVHGDCKSSTGGTWHLEIMETSDGKYKVKVVGTSKQDKYDLEYSSQPSFETIVSDLKSKV